MTETRHVPPPQVSASEQNNIGMVVIRGNSVVMIEALEKLWAEAEEQVRDSHRQPACGKS